MLTTALIIVGVMTGAIFGSALAVAIFRLSGKNKRRGQHIHKEIAQTLDPLKRDIEERTEFYARCENEVDKKRIKQEISVLGTKFIAIFNKLKKNRNFRVNHGETFNYYNQYCNKLIENEKTDAVQNVNHKTTNNEIDVEANLKAFKARLEANKKKKKKLLSTPTKKPPVKKLDDSGKEISK